MTTYVIQYINNGSWYNYCSDDNFMIEFMSLCAAKSVAADLASSDSGLFPNKKNQWQIVDSHGNKHAI